MAASISMSNGKRPFARVFIRDFGLGLTIRYGLLLIPPGGWDAKLFAFAATLLIAAVATVVEIRKPRPAVLPRAEVTLSRGIAAFPTMSRLRRSGIVTGAFARGEYSGQHFAVGLAENGLTWWIARSVPDTEALDWREGIPHHDLRQLFEGWDARFLEDGNYAAEVIGIYFPELLAP